MTGPVLRCSCQAEVTAEGPCPRCRRPVRFTNRPPAPMDVCTCPGPLERRTGWNPSCPAHEHDDYPLGDY